MKILGAGGSSCAATGYPDNRLKLTKVWARIWAQLVCADGQDLVEYVLVTGLIAMAVVASFRNLATPLVALLNHVASTVAAA